MLILTDYNRPYVVDSLDTPMVVKHNWVFDGTLCDFLLAPIVYLEETTGPALLIRINGTELWIPSSWSILVTDYETYQLDTVTIESCAKVKHVAFAFLPDEMKLRTFNIEIIDYVSKKSIVHPMINKGTALVHPVGPVISKGKEQHASIIIGPNDLHKFMGSRTIGDVFS